MRQPNTPAQRVQEGRWTKLPDQLLELLTPREHQLVHLLLSYAWTPEAAIYPSVRTMARRLRCSERTIQRALRALEGRGYLVIEARYRDDQGQQSNLYHPGPLLVAMLPPASDRAVRGRDDQGHPPVTRWAPKRDSGNREKRTTRPEPGYTRATVDPSRYTGGSLGRYIRT